MAKMDKRFIRAGLNQARIVEARAVRVQIILEGGTKWTKPVGFLDRLVGGSKTMGVYRILYTPLFNKTKNVGLYYTLII